MHIGFSLWVVELLIRLVCFSSLFFLFSVANFDTLYLSIGFFFIFLSRQCYSLALDFFFHPDSVTVF